jgi:hypothetical protein
LLGFSAGRGAEEKRENGFGGVFAAVVSRPAPDLESVDPRRLRAVILRGMMSSGPIGGERLETVSA